MENFGCEKFLEKFECKKKVLENFPKTFPENIYVEGAIPHNFCGKSPETRLDLFAADYLGKFLTPELIVFFHRKGVVMP